MSQWQISTRQYQLMSWIEAQQLTLDYETPRSRKKEEKALNCLLASLKAIAVLLVSAGYWMAYFFGGLLIKVGTDALA